MDTVILVILSAIANAVHDTHIHHHYKSIWKDWKNPYFWADSWKNKYTNRDPIQGRNNTPIWFTDIMHTAKSIHITCLIGAIVTNQYNNIWAFIAYGLIWNMTFTLFYDYILIRYASNNK